MKSRSLYRKNLGTNGQGRASVPPLPLTVAALLTLTALVLVGCKPSSLFSRGSKEAEKPGEAATPQLAQVTQGQAAAQPQGNQVDPASLIGLDFNQVTAALGKATGQMGNSQMMIWYYPNYEVRFANGKVIQARPRAARTSAPSPLSLPSTAPARPVAPRPIASSSKVKAVETIRGKGARIDIKEHMPRGKVTIIDFFADWCGPCKAISPHLESLANSDPDVVLRKIDIVTWDTPVVKQYRISSVPNMRVYDANGRQVGKATSSLSEVKAYVAKAKK